MWLRIKPDELQLQARRLDVQFWLRTMDKYKSVRKRLPRKADKITGADIFDLLYHWQPQLKADPDDLALAAWLKTHLDMPEIEALRRKTMGDANKSAFAAIKLFQELMRPRESVFRSIVEVKNSVQTVSTSDSPEAEMAKEAIKKIQKSLAETVERQGPELALRQRDMTGMSESIASEVTAAASDASKVSHAVENVSQDFDAIQELASVMSSSKEFELNSSDEQILELGLDDNLMRTIRGQEEFRRILRTAGRLKLLAGELKSRKPKPAPTPIGLTYGNDLSNLVPQELAFLDDPDLEDLFFRRYAESGLLLYDRKRKLIEGRGPIVCCVDMSGSMRGTPEQNAKAMFLQLTRTAVEQRRKIAYIPFATNAGDPLFVESPRDLVSVITPQRYSKLGGGTDFNKALTAADEVITKQNKYKNADVIFMTDGYSRVSSHISEAIRKHKSEWKYRILGVLFAGNWPTEMKPLLDLSVKVDDRGTISWAEELLDRIV